jgi:O-Antigen ligase
MEVGGQPGIPAPGAGSVSEAPGAKRVLAKAHPLRARDVQLYRACEDLTELLVCLMVVFSPWAFGTTQPWSIWLMNAAGYLLGLLFAAKLAIRCLKGYHPPRWDGNGTTRPQDNETTGQQDYGSTRPQDCASGPWSVVTSPWSVVRSPWSVVRGRQSLATGLIALLAVLTVAILGYCLLGAVNARATFHRDELNFAYRRCIMWLPHSLDSCRTWLAFWTYLGLACSFWAIRDWLLGKSEGEERAGRLKPQPGGSDSGPLLPARLRRLLWVLAVNGALLGAEGIAQRLEGSGKLLFLVKPRVNPGADTQFGPYAYRANASQYFNLLWPVCLGFWWTLNRSHGARRGVHHLLLFFSAIMAACPIISTSRGGALVTVAIIALATFFLVFSHFLLTAHRQSDRRTRRITVACLALFFSGALALGFALGWRTLKPRMDHISEDVQIRQKMYEKARPMAGDYPLFGTGPGTFETVFPLYRFSTETYWPAQLHNDWLETRITFGWLGSGLIALALVGVLLRWFARGGIHGGRRFIILTWLALAGCLVHARYDFPFQIYSIVLLFLVLCAILSNLTRRPR